MEFLPRPNLPDSAVHTMLISGQYPFLRRDLEGLGIGVLLTEPSAVLPVPVRYHPDLVCAHLGGERFLLAAPGLEPAFARLGARIVHPLCPPEGCYPSDTALCGGRLGRYLFCRSASTDPALLESGEVLPVRQGYAKCSILPVNERSLITGDPSIAAAAKKAGLEVLEIRPGFILLEGYDTGFIGGCGGLLGPDRLYLTGKLRHPDRDAILAFTRQRGVSVVEGSASCLVDAGSLLPLTQRG